MFDDRFILLSSSFVFLFYFSFWQLRVEQIKLNLSPTSNYDKMTQLRRKSEEVS